MKALVILQLAVLAFSTAASAQATTTLINDNWVVGRDFPAWSVEAIDTSDKHSGTSSLMIDSCALTGNLVDRGNMAVFINTESTAPYVNPAQTMGTVIANPIGYSLSFAAKLGSAGVGTTIPGQPGTMTFQVNILNNLWGNSGTQTGTLQAFNVTMTADDQWHTYSMPFTVWVNDPSKMSVWTTLGNIEIYHQNWGGFGFGDGTADVLLHVDDFELAQLIAPTVHYKGDFTGDGKVDDGDYTWWADHYGKPKPPGWVGPWPPWAPEPPPFPPIPIQPYIISDADYTVWADNFGKQNAYTPEPASLSLLLLGGLAMLRRRGRASK